MSGKHTSGPWEWRTDQFEPFQTQWSLSPGILIAEGYDGTPGGDEHDRANARLIATAPELLDALKDAVGLLERHYPVPARNGQINRARAAIAKATRS